MPSRVQYESEFTYPYDTQPARRAPEELSRPVAAPSKMALAVDGPVTLPTGASGAATVAGAMASTVTQRQAQRILRQLGSYLRDPHPSIEVCCCVDVVVVACAVLGVVDESWRPHHLLVPCRAHFVRMCVSSLLQCFPSENNVAFWQFLLSGPADTPYQGGVWLGYVLFPKNYPISPPEVRFVTPVR